MYGYLLCIYSIYDFVTCETSLIHPIPFFYQDVSFELKPGQITALVGYNSSGKSTCVKLLERFYQPQAGEILLDGEPLKSYKDQYLHDKVVCHEILATFCIWIFRACSWHCHLIIWLAVSAVKGRYPVESSKRIYFHHVKKAHFNFKFLCHCHNSNYCKEFFSLSGLFICDAEEGLQNFSIQPSFLGGGNEEF